MAVNSSLFTKATKAQAKARIALAGPSGAGKTMWALELATALKGDGEIAFIDTERSSASLYADKFDFQTMSMSPPYDPNRLIQALNNAEDAGFSVIVIDSLTHFWSGKGGVLDIVNQATSKGKNSYTAWAEGTPIHQAMIDALLAFNGHVIVTMRSKTEYSMDKTANGKTEITKLGMAPQQRDGIEYEFTLFLDVDLQHRVTVSKSRCAPLADRTFATYDGAELMTEFTNWLDAGDALIDRNQKDALDGKIRSLSDAGRHALKDLWSEAGLPKVTNLPVSRVTEAEELIQRALEATQSPSV
jgi:hypothetical protein